MFKRFYVSIFQPKLTGSFLKDKLPYVFIYILFLSLIVNIPSIIESSFQKNFNPSIKRSLESTLYKSETTATIIDYQLTTDESLIYQADSGSYAITFNGSPTSLNISFNFKKDTLELYVGPTLVNTYTYRDLELESIEFNMKKSQDRITFDHLLSKVYLDVKPLFITGSILAFIFNEFVTYILLVLISVWSYSYFRPKLKMRYRFIMASYGFSVFFITVLLANLYDFQLLRVLGVILGFSFTRKAYIYLIQRKEEESAEV